MQNEKKVIRPSIMPAIRKMLQIYLEHGIITVDEYNTIVSELGYIAKHGERKPAIMPRLVTPQEAAEMLSISYSQFRALEKENAFPFRRRSIGGKTVRYLNTEILDYMEVGSIAKNAEENDKK